MTNRPCINCLHWQAAVHMHDAGGFEVVLGNCRNDSRPLGLVEETYTCDRWSKRPTKIETEEI